MLNQHDQMQKSYRKAAEILGSELEINPRSGRNWMMLAYYSAKLGEQSRAISELSEAEKRGASDLESQLLRAQMFVLFGEREKAIQLTIDLLSRGLSRVDVDLAVDLRSVLNEPRLHAVLEKSKRP